MLEEEDDGRDGNEGAEARGNVGVDGGNAHVRETRGNRLEDGDVVLVRVGLVAKVNPGKDGEDDDDESRAESVDEEGGAADDMGAAVLLKVRADGADRVEEDETAETVRGIALGGGEVLEAVNDDLVGTGTGVKLLAVSHERSDLTSGDRDAMDGGKVSSAIWSVRKEQRLTQIRS